MINDLTQAFVRGFLKQAGDVPLPPDLSSNLLQIASGSAEGQTNLINALKNVQTPFTAPTTGQVLGDMANPFGNLAKHFERWGNTNALSDLKEKLNTADNYSGSISNIVRSQAPEPTWFRRVVTNPGNSNFLSSLKQTVQNVRSTSMPPQAPQNPTVVSGAPPASHNVAGPMLGTIVKKSGASTGQHVQTNAAIPQNTNTAAAAPLRPDLKPARPAYSQATSNEVARAIAAGPVTREQFNSSPQPVAPQVNGHLAAQAPTHTAQPRSQFQMNPSSLTNLVDSIFHAEGGTNTSHPYGILQNYQHTTPRQATFNTVNHAYRDWTNDGSHGDFLRQLQERYAPVGAHNDPQNLNNNWYNNVSRIFNSYQNGSTRPRPTQ